MASGPGREADGTRRRALWRTPHRRPVPRRRPLMHHPPGRPWSCRGQQSGRNSRISGITGPRSARGCRGAGLTGSRRTPIGDSAPAGWPAGCGQVAEPASAVRPERPEAIGGGRSGRKPPGAPTGRGPTRRALARYGRRSALLRPRTWPRYGPARAPHGRRKRPTAGARSGFASTVRTGRRAGSGPRPRAGRHRPHRPWPGRAAPPASGTARSRRPRRRCAARPGRRPRPACPARRAAS